MATAILNAARLRAILNYDQYRMFNKRDAVIVGRAWAADTQRRIYAMGLWPKNLPYPVESLDA